MRADFHLFDALKEQEILLLSPGLLVGLDVLRMSPRCGGSWLLWWLEHLDQANAASRSAAA